MKTSLNRFGTFGLLYLAFVSALIFIVDEIAGILLLYFHDSILSILKGFVDIAFIGPIMLGLCYVFHSSFREKVYTTNKCNGNCNCK